MKAFEYANPASLDEAVGHLSDSWGDTEVLAGGTDLITSLKQDITQPNVVVSLSKIKDLRGIEKDGDTLRVGATTTLSEFVANNHVKENFPALVTAAQNIGAPQILNMGTVGGDLLQRPRCWYYRMGFGLLAMYNDESLVPKGDNRYHAIFGNSGPAYFVNPSSLAPGLVALDASVTLQGPNGDRDVKAAEFFTAPASESEREYVIKPNEVLTSVNIPLKGLANGVYEIRQRRGLDWPMVAAAVAFENSGGKARNAKVVLGHVAPVPWHSEAASKALNGQSANDETAMQVGEAASQGATPLSRNEYKVHQVKIAVKRAIQAAVA